MTCIVLYYYQFDFKLTNRRMRHKRTKSISFRITYTQKEDFHGWRCAARNSTLRRVVNDEVCERLRSWTEITNEGAPWNREWRRLIRWRLWKDNMVSIEAVWWMEGLWGRISQIFSLDEWLVKFILFFLINNLNIYPL